MHLYKTSSRAKKKSAQKERTNAGTGRSANQRRGRNGGARSRFHHRVDGGEYRRQYTAHREAAPLAADVARGFHAGRSAGTRVGKECGSAGGYRWAPYL